MLKDLHLLPRVEDGWSFLYVEHCRIEQEARSISVWDAEGRTMVPCAMLSLLMLGPGSSITHAAVRVLVESGCTLLWCGEEGVRTYAFGLGETRSARNLLRQAAAWAGPDTRMRVVLRMYELRFGEPVDPSASLEQLRGREGKRVRQAYLRASRETGIPWSGRKYDRRRWDRADPINRALSSANSCLYGLCHAAICAAGYSPSIGFIHTGKALSFVFDVADLYKTESSIPVAFRAAADRPGDLEGTVRRRMRDAFRELRLCERIVRDLHSLFDNLGPPAEIPPGFQYDEPGDPPAEIWDPTTGAVAGGVNYEHSDGGDDFGEGSCEPPR